ncbi:MAG: hypothetical protein FD149_2174 [Rhodospirillaceae bacterium]|nr:MAG: hypothetical protein FD149_2174 [Rhodospirillaceae bacterium]
MMNPAKGRGASPFIRQTGWRTELAALHIEEIAQKENDSVSFPQKTALQYRKWSLIHRVLYDNPFHVSERLPRHEQWSRVRDYTMKNLAEPEIVDWLTQQIDIARHLAQGISDLRPHKNGPCHAVLMEWVASRKRKALAVHHWALAAEAADVPIHVEHRHPLC